MNAEITVKTDTSTKGNYRKAGRMKLLTTQEAADRLGVTSARIRAMILAGRLPAEKFGHVHMVREEDLALVADRKPGRPKQSAESKKAAKPRAKKSGSGK